jgi:UDP:flavonoid glycosyltransferase YjiC (YdhE family)
MARFFIVTFPLAGHVNPALPIVEKLIEHKHEVLWITGRLFKERVVALGAQYLPLPQELDPGGKAMARTMFALNHSSPLAICYRAWM